MKTYPFISIIIPVYNADKTILNTLESVKRQTFNDYEIIIINDGSSDNSVNLINNFINNSPLLKVSLTTQNNSGVSSARNFGMKLALGDYIAFLDSDDEWLPNKLELQVGILNDNPKIDFLGTNRNDEIIENVLWYKFNYITRVTPKMLLFKFLFIVPTVIFKTEIIKNIGYFDENQRHAEEGNFFLKICNKYNCYLLKESLVNTGFGKAHFGESGLSGNIYAMEIGELKNIKFAYTENIINTFEFLFFTIFSIIKFFRRILIVKLIR
jgi:glycosyltransferase involved in cell wall biosynthesis